MAASSATSKSKTKQSVETRSRLEECWEKDVEWDLYPSFLTKGCKQVGKALNMPPTAVLGGMLILTIFAMSHAVVDIPYTNWSESVLVWVSIGMPTGSGKTPLYKYMCKLLERARNKCKADKGPSWLLEEATFEKMGAMMAENHAKLLGLYDELSTFLTQINLYNGRGLADSHDLAIFLQLYNGNPWTRRTVHGDANFSMERTSLTIGGFTQPSVARNLIEMPANAEKGLSQRFLWFFPKLCYSKFRELEPVDEDFSDDVELLKNLWKTSSDVGHVWSFPMPCPPFETRYDAIQEHLEALSGMGMLSKSKGQIIRVSAAFHALFHLHNPGAIPKEISNEAILGATDFVDMCTQHVAFMAGRGEITEHIARLIAEKDKETPLGSDHSMLAYTLLLPGATLNLSSLLMRKKFVGKGNKEGAVEAFRELQKAGLGQLLEIKAQRGTACLYEFKKCRVPENASEKRDLADKLMAIGVSLRDYRKSLEAEELPQKRSAAGSDAPDARRSPRIAEKQSHPTQESAITPRSLF